MDVETHDFVLGFLAKHFHCYVDFIRHEGYDNALNIMVSDIRESKNSMFCVLPGPILAMLLGRGVLFCPLMLPDVPVHAKGVD